MEVNKIQEMKKNQEWEEARREEEMNMKTDDSGWDCRAVDTDFITDNGLIHTDYFIHFM